MLAFNLACGHVSGTLNALQCLQGKLKFCLPLNVDRVIIKGNKVLLGGGNEAIIHVSLTEGKRHGYPTLRGT